MNTEQSRQQYIAERQKTQETRQAAAAETLKNHVYTVLVDQDNIKAWRCKAPNSTAYAFDIMMTRFGMSVVGDIDNLTFEVGLGYGIKFLAGDDVTYYTHSKLTPHCREREFDESAFLDALVNGISERITEHYQLDDEAFAALPEWLRAGAGGACMAERWTELTDIIWGKVQELEVTDDAYEFWDELDDLRREANGICDPTQAHMFMAEYHEKLGLCEDTYEITVDRPSESLIRRLYMINHAAKAIMAAQPQVVAA